MPHPINPLARREQRVEATMGLDTSIYNRILKRKRPDLTPEERLRIAKQRAIPARAARIAYCRGYMQQGGVPTEEDWAAFRALPAESPPEVWEEPHPAWVRPQRHREREWVIADGRVRDLKVIE